MVSHLWVCRGSSWRVLSHPRSVSFFSSACATRVFYFFLSTEQHAEDSVRKSFPWALVEYSTVRISGGGLKFGFFFFFMWNSLYYRASFLSKSCCPQPSLLIVIGVRMSTLHLIREEECCKNPTKHSTSSGIWSTGSPARAWTIRLMESLIEALLAERKLIAGPLLRDCYLESSVGGRISRCHWAIFFFFKFCSVTCWWLKYHDMQHSAWKRVENTLRILGSRSRAAVRSVTCWCAESDYSISWYWKN